jgi:hypothetical protein
LKYMNAGISRFSIPIHEKMFRPFWLKYSAKKYSEIYFENSKTKSHFQCWQLKPCIKLLGLNGWVKWFTSHVFRAWNRSDHESNILLIRNSMVSRAIWKKHMHSWVFQKLQITLVLQAHAISIVFQ